MKCIELIVTKMDIVVVVRSQGRRQTGGSAQGRGVDLGPGLGRGLEVAHGRVQGERRDSMRTRGSVCTLLTSSLGWTRETLKGSLADTEL